RPHGHTDCIVHALEGLHQGSLCSRQLGDRRDERLVRRWLAEPPARGLEATPSCGLAHIARPPTGAGLTGRIAGDLRDGAASGVHAHPVGARTTLIGTGELVLRTWASGGLPP